MLSLISQDWLNKFIAEGYSTIKLTGDVRKAINDVFTVAKPFFDEDLEKKLLNRLPENGGYRPYGIEYSLTPDSPDQIESFTVSDRTCTTAGGLNSGNAIELHQKLLILLEILESIAETLVTRLAETVSCDSYQGKFEKALRRWSSLQLNHSHPAQISDPFINDLHEDGTLITLLHATGPGFELQTADGGFIPFTTAKDELLVIPSVITWLMSGGLIKPLYHQVRTIPNHSDRFALIYLGDLPPELCKPWVCNEVNTNIDIGELVRVSASLFGLQNYQSE